MLEAPEDAKSFGAANLMRVKHTRFTQPIMNVILLLLAIPCVLTREPGKLKQGATVCLALMGLAMGSIFLCQQIANTPPTPAIAPHWPAIMAWVSPDIRPTTAGPPPLNGTWVICMPVVDSRSTVFKWMKLP